MKLAEPINAKPETQNTSLNPLWVKFIKWSNTLKQFFGKLPMNCLSVFDHFVRLSLKGLMRCLNYITFVFLALR